MHTILVAITLKMFLRSKLCFSAICYRRKRGTVGQRLRSVIK